MAFYKRIAGGKREGDGKAAQIQMFGRKKLDLWKVHGTKEHDKYHAIFHIMGKYCESGNAMLENPS